MQCTECGKEMRQVPAGVSKNTGRPYKSFWACPDRHRQGKPQQQVSQPSTSDPSKRDGFVMVMEELQEIHRIVDWIQLNMVQEGKGEIGKPFDAKKEDIPIVEEQEDEELKNIPF